MRLGGRGSAPTLSGRLTRWLITLSFGVLGILCSGVYIAVQVGLESRQRMRLEKASEAIGHLVEKSGEHVQAESFLHDMEDIIKIDKDLHLRLGTSQGEQLYLPSAAIWPDAARKIGLRLEYPSTALGYSNGELALDIANDAELLENLRAVLWAAALLGCTAISLGGYLIVRMGLVPVRLLADQTEHLAASSLDRRLDSSSSIPAELAPLIDQFNGLLGRLEKAYVQLEGFNADVAHELRTPLTTIIAHCELVLRGSAAENDLRDCIASNLEEMHRLSSIVADMLFLSHADRGEKARNTAIPSLSKLCHEVVEYYEAVLLESDLTCEIVGEASGSFDAPLLRRVVSNLLSNAVRHGRTGTSVEIRITRDRDGTGLSVYNEGETIPSETLPYIFDRFYRGGSPLPDHVHHHGLGLAIVGAIARMHDGRTFAHSDAGGTEIGIWLPSQAS